MTCVCNNRLADAIRRGDRPQVEREILDRLTGKEPSVGPVSWRSFRNSQTGARVRIFHREQSLVLEHNGQLLQTTDAAEAARLTAGALLPDES